MSVELEEKIVRAAERWKVSKSEWVKKACEAYLKPSVEVPIIQTVAKPVPANTEEIERYAILMRNKHLAEIDLLIGKIRVLRKRG